MFRRWSYAGTGSKNGFEVDLTAGVDDLAGMKGRFIDVPCEL